MPSLSLVVLCCKDIDRAATFYAELGLQLEKHAHGAGPLHYACEQAGIVFELYPASDKSPVTSSTRIGFAVEDVNASVDALARIGAKVVTPPADSLWGRRTVIRDFDGHTVELTAGA